MAFAVFEAFEVRDLLSLSWKPIDYNRLSRYIRIQRKTFRPGPMPAIPADAKHPKRKGHRHGTIDKALGNVRGFRTEYSDPHKQRVFRSHQNLSSRGGGGGLEEPSPVSRCRDSKIGILLVRFSVSKHNPKRNPKIPKTPKNTELNP